MNEKITFVIAGFPGVGKSYSGYNDIRCFDHESSNVHWLKPGVERPDWQVDYVNQLELAIESGKYDFCFTSTHEVVLSELVRRNMPFIIVAPATKKVFIQRYKERGSSDAFIQKLDENWISYINSLKTYDKNVILTDMYLSDLLYDLNPLNKDAKYGYIFDNEFNGTEPETYVI